MIEDYCLIFENFTGMCDVNQYLSKFLMFWYYAYGEKYFELVQFWLNFLEERRLVA